MRHIPVDSVTRYDPLWRIEGVGTPCNRDRRAEAALRACRKLAGRIHVRVWDSKAMLRGNTRFLQTVPRAQWRRGNRGIAHRFRDYV
jgi:hypothetical protein